METIENYLTAIYSLYSFLKWIVAGIVARIENLLIIISSLGIMIVVILVLLVLTIIIFNYNISKPYRNRVAKYKLDKKINDATERNQIKTKDTVYVWLEYIYSLIDKYKEYKESFRMVKIYCEWLIGFFRFTVSGRWIATIFAIYLVLGTYIQQSHQQRLATFSNTIAQTEVFLHSKYPTQVSISNDKGQQYYYGSAIDLKGALEFLHKNGRVLDYLYLPHSQLSEINLLGAKLEGGVFNGANLYKSNLSGTHLSEANLRGTNLIEAFLLESKLNKANLEEANLSGAYLGKADLRRVNMRKANLSGSHLSKVNLNNANLQEANLNHAQLREARLNWADMQKADLRRSYFRDAQLFFANLSKANLSNAEFSGARLIGAKFEKANLKLADFSKADLFKAKFHGTNMEEANLRGAHITATDFTDAENLTIKQIAETCWLRTKAYTVDEEEITIPAQNASPPILPEYLDISVDSIYPVHFFKSSIGLPYCPY